MKLSVEQRLFNRRNIRIDTNCWEWTGALDGYGYGVIKVNRKLSKVHRVAATIWRTIPIGLSVLHACDNRKCFNPDHLFFGTQKDNIQDCIDKGRFIFPHGINKPFCKHGHPLSAESFYVYPNGRRECRACKKNYHKKLVQPS